MATKLVLKREGQPDHFVTASKEFVASMIAGGYELADKPKQKTALELELEAEALAELEAEEAAEAVAAIPEAVTANTADEVVTPPSAKKKKVGKKK